jgi:hypothetical protein
MENENLQLGDVIKNGAVGKQIKFFDADNNECSITFNQSNIVVETSDKVSEIEYTGNLIDITI